MRIASFVVFHLFAGVAFGQTCIELVALPGKTVSWEKFVLEYPPYSIALDGFVSAPAMRDPLGPRANYDHHKGVDRVTTRSTSDQVYLEINLGLFKAFQKDGVPHAQVYVNDCDEDTCLAFWLLKNHERVVGHGEPLINRLLFCEDRLDCMAGMYPFRDSETLRQLAWVFEPYQAARREGRLSGISPEGLKSIVESVEQRITRYSLGAAGALALDGRYETIGGGSGWSFVEKTGPSARMMMAQAGISAYAMKIGDGRYSIGRMSVWVPFPLEEIFADLNAAEPEGLVTDTNRWGGSNTIGGSPRDTGTKLSHAQIEAVINARLARK